MPPILGGSTEKIWHRLAREFVAAGHTVTMVSRRWPGWPNVETELDGRLTHLRLRGCSHTRFLPINLVLDFFWGLQAAWNLPKADIVVCNTVSLPVYLKWIKKSAGLVAVVLGRMPKGQNRAYASVDKLLATSTAVADKIHEENASLAQRIFRFPNPIDWKLHRDSSTQHLGGPLVIGYIGRIHPEKGLEQLLDAALMLAQRTDLPPWRVELTGPVAIEQGGGGEAYRNTLAEKYQTKLGERFLIRPPVYNATELAQIYGRMGVFCYPSLAAKGEGLSIAPMEAMAAGAVAVVSTLDCYRDLIRPDQNGFQFDQSRPDAVAQLGGILSRLLLEPSLRAQVAAQGQLDVRRHDYAETARALLDEFGKMTADSAKKQLSPAS
ncbi:glycosyltransferase family 4 protein [Oleiharenicola lentus]|uniref:glycosyltransferase family 4 protein n=1 Tax=Oleiharenicola lentus TaxID=2508720 RepID=UPI003F6799D2